MRDPLRSPLFAIVHCFRSGALACRQCGIHVPPICHPHAFHAPEAALPTTKFVQVRPKVPEFDHSWPEFDQSKLSNRRGQGAAI